MITRLVGTNCEAYFLEIETRPKEACCSALLIGIHGDVQAVLREVIQAIRTEKGVVRRALKNVRLVRPIDAVHLIDHDARSSSSGAAFTTDALARRMVRYGISQAEKTKKTTQ
jgi:hypothetical protein